MQKIFVNGTIISMDERCLSPEAVLVDGEDIIKVGSRDEVFDEAGDGAKIVDLKGRTLLPGFFDPHGHLVTYAIASRFFVDVRCAPVGKVTSIPQLIRIMKESEQARQKKGPIVGFGYDDTLCEEGRMLEADDLDQISTERAVIVIHSSFHLVMANHKAMEITGTDQPGFQPKGGVVRRRNGVAIGVFEEMAAAEKLMNLAIDPLRMAELPFEMRGICEEYLRQGVTTICEGAGANDVVKLIKAAMTLGNFPARYIACPSLTEDGKIPPRIMGRHIINGPVKLLMDGSIQCYTAALSTPYATPAPGHEDEQDYCGYTHMSREELQEHLEMILDSNRSFAIHSNGDAALDEILDALESCTNLSKNTYKRNLIIHCQTVRDDQLDRMKQLNLFPSFFPAHLYVWGDRHYETFLGPERANRLDPAGSAVEKKIPFSLHNDAPVTNTRPLEAVWNAVTRRTREGRVLGEEQRISVEEALKGVTIYAAFQYKVDDILGSISEGKKADFIALDKNPLMVSPDELLTLRIERVWIDGEVVWSDICREKGIKTTAR